MSGAKEKKSKRKTATKSPLADEDYDGNAASTSGMNDYFEDQQNSALDLIQNASMDEIQKTILKTVLNIETTVLSLEKRISLIENRFQSIENDIKQTNANVKTVSNDVEKNAKQTKLLGEQIENTATEVEAYKLKCQALDTEYKNLLEKHLALDSYNRKENLIFHGIKSVRNEQCSDLIRNFMKVDLKIPDGDVDAMQFQRCHRLSEKPDASIICRFVSYHDRSKVWDAKSNLRGTQKMISEQFAPEIESRRRILYPILKVAKGKKMKASLQYDQLKIDGVKFSVDNLDTLPQDLSPTQTKNGITCFFTGGSPLSNFHKVNFNLDGETYDCVERCLQLRKAQLAQRPQDVKRIKHAIGPAQCKTIGDSIKLNEDNWLAEARRFAYRACRAKFLQNDACKEYLLATGNNELAEASPNNVWGIGLKMDKPEAFQKDKWRGQNLLGNILMAIRRELSQ